jgi:group I intron endonuclease
MYSALGGRKITMSHSPEQLPVKVYTNADKSKELIIEDNKGQSGIYRWVHIESGKSYIGSSVKLNIRFRQYFNYNHISYPKRKLRIYWALLKYGYSGFRLEILEYCPANILIQREQFYFDMFKPVYNTLKIAGSPLGYRHSETAKKLISMANKDKTVSESSRALKREALLGNKFDPERIENMRLSNTFRQPVLLTNTETGNIKEFSSMSDAGIYLGISRVSVRKYLLSSLPYKGYIITKAPSKDTGFILSSFAVHKTTKSQAVLVTNQITGISKQFFTNTDAAEYMQVSRGRLWYFLKTANTDNDTLNGYKITKLDDYQCKVKRSSKKIEVTNIETNVVTIYSSYTLAAEALGVRQSSLSTYFCASGKRKSTNPFKKKYILKLV